MRPEISAASYMFHGSIAEVDKLYKIHGTITEGIQGKGRNLTPALLKSSIIFTCASWETFIEEVCQAGVKLLVKEAKSCDLIPNGIKSKISEELKASKNPLDLWKLGGDAWKDLVLQKCAQLCDGTAGGLNTPNYHNISKLFKDTLGISSLKESWSWSGITPDASVKKLNRLLEVRGAIAHGKSAQGLNINTCRDYSNHVERLVNATCTKVDYQINMLIESQ